MTPPGPPPRRILLIQIVKLGDVLLSTALLDDLRRAAPDAQIDMLVGPAASALLDHHPLITDRLIYTEPAAPGLAWRIRQNRYDWIVDVQSSPASAPLVGFSGAPVRVGWRIRKPWVWAYTHTLQRGGRDPEFVVRERRRLLELIDIDVGTTRPRLYLTDAEKTEADQTLTALGLNGGRPLVGISLSASVPMKDWPVDRWATVADALAADGAQPVVLLANGDEQKAYEFTRRSNAATLLPPRGIRAFCAVLARLNAYVSPDTGPAHFAMALGVPTVTLYTPGNAVFWNPRDPLTIALEAPALPRCRECAVQPLAKRELLTHHCMPLIFPPRVIDAVRGALLRGGEGKASEFTGPRLVP